MSLAQGIRVAMGFRAESGEHRNSVEKKGCQMQLIAPTYLNGPFQSLGFLDQNKDVQNGCNQFKYNIFYVCP